MWWNEIRTEIRSHARSMNCHAVLGYTEQTAIWLASEIVYCLKKTLVLGCQECSFIIDYFVCETKKYFMMAAAEALKVFWGVCSHFFKK